MERTRLHPASAWLFLVIALLTIGSGPRVNAATYGAEIRVYPMDNSSMSVGGLIDLQVVDASGAPFTLARTFRSEMGDDLLLLLSGISGQFNIFELTDLGTLGDMVQSGNLGNRGWRSAEFTYAADGEVTLHLFGSRDGLIRVHAVNADGEVVEAPSAETNEPSFEMKSMFSAFDSATGSRVLAYDPMSGATSLSALPVGLAAESSKSSGYTDIDHTVFAGVLVRLLYKSVGHPFVPQELAVGEAGRLVIETLSGSGFAAQTMIDSIWASSFDAIRFYPMDGGNVGLFSYRRDVPTMSRTSMLIGSATSMQHVQLFPTGLASDQDDIRFFRRNGTTFLIGVDFRPEYVPFTSTQAARFAQCVDDNLEDRAAGYQLALLQGGEVLLDRAEGVRGLSDGSAAMTRDTSQDMASVGKMMTTVTTLRLEDLDPEFDIDASIVEVLDDLDSGGWPKLRSPRDLMAQTSGANRSSPSCTSKEDLTTDCTAFFTTAAPLAEDCTDGVGGLLCPRSYANPNFGGLREIVEALTGAKTTIDIDDETRELWLSSIMSDGPSCFRDVATSKWFGACRAGEDCVQGPDGRLWVEGQSENFSNDWSSSCGAGGWMASARDMVRVMEALRGEQILSAENTAELFRTDLTDVANKPTALGWEGPQELILGEDLTLSKNGTSAHDNGVGRRAEIINFSGDAHAALFVNTSNGAPAPGAVLRTAYAYAKSGADCERIMTVAELNDFGVGEKADTYAIEYVSDSLLISANRILEGWWGHAPKDGLNLRTWALEPTGELTPRDSLNLGPFASQIRSFTRLLKVGAGRVVAATRTKSGVFQVLLIGVDEGGKMSLLDFEEPPDGVGDATLVPLTVGHVDFATVAMRGDGRLQVAAWAVTGLKQDTLVRFNAGMYTSPGSVSEVDGAAGQNPGDVLTVIRTASGKVKPIFFTIDAGGTVTRMASAAGSQQALGVNLRIAAVEVAGATKFVTAHVSSQDKLMLSVWSYNHATEKLSRDWNTTSVDADSIGAQIVATAGAHVAIPVRQIESDGDIVSYVRIYRMTNSGELESTVSKKLGETREIALTSRTQAMASHHTLTPAYRLTSGHMKIGHWEVIP